MFVDRAHIKLSVVLALTSVALFTTSAFGQSPEPKTNSPRLENPVTKVAASKPEPGSAENKVPADEPKSKDLKDEIEVVKAENAVVREILRKMEEQQRQLLEQVERLERRLDGGTAADVSIAGQPIAPPTSADATLPVTNRPNVPVPATNAANNSAQPAPINNNQGTDDRYRDGIIIWETPEDAKVPFLLEAQQQYPSPISKYTFIRRYFHRPSGQCPRG